MTGYCSVCGEKHAPRGERFFACGACWSQIEDLSAEDIRYGWYLSAVKRALFPKRDEFGAPASAENPHEALVISTARFGDV